VSITSRVDHLVIAADTLAQGVAWCEATLGVTPGPGGEHTFMGTHNRLLRIATPAFPRAYLEIIAINPDAVPPWRTRWFDLDDEALRESIRVQPRLVHFVASTPDGSAALQALAALDIDRGPLLRAQRETPAGWLRWQITVRPDGQRLFDGGLPTLIEWGDTHPCDAMPESGLSLESLTMHHPDVRLAAAYTAVRLERVHIKPGPPNLSATLRGPRGLVTIESAGA
jgi:hypothetical protein